MTRPKPTWIYHFTHIDHLRSIVRGGLVCDNDAHRPGLLSVEVGNASVKQRRRYVQVPVGPGGVVADYVPFYFVPRNLMLYQIKTGKVPTFTGGQDGLIFLCTTLERLIELGLPWVASSRNAATSLAKFTDDVDRLDGHIDWPLATTSTFDITSDDPERPKRHQAELLVHRCLPWEAVKYVGTRTEDDLNRVEQVLGSLGGHQPGRNVRGHWYF